MITEARHVSALTPALKVSPEIPSTTTAPPQPESSSSKPSDDWQTKWLRLETAHHPKLRELEKEITKFCRDMWRDPQSGRILLLHGENGSGKTHCAKAVSAWVLAVGYSKEFVSRANHIRHLDHVYWHWPNLIDRLKSGGWDLLDDMFDCALLIIDELGGGHDPSGVGVDKLCQVLTHRENKWTLITTNIQPAAWEEKFDRRIASRFYRSCTQIDLSSVPDFNLK